jgi:hypothetical protein
VTAAPGWPPTSSLPFFPPREQVAPVFLRDVDAVLAGRCPDPLPGSVPLLVGNAFHLVEPRNRVPHVRRIAEGFFALGGEGELRVSQAIFCAVLMLLSLTWSEPP